MILTGVVSDEREIAALRAENLQLRERLAERERDLDEVRRSSECHRQRADTLEEVLRAVPDLFFQVARDGTILRCIMRPSGDFYMPPGEFMGKPMQDILPPDLGRQFVEALTKFRYCRLEQGVEAKIGRVQLRPGVVLSLHGGQLWPRWKT